MLGEASFHIEYKGMVIMTQGSDTGLRGINGLEPYITNVKIHATLGGKAESQAGS